MLGRADSSSIPVFAGQLSGLHILVVEDNADALEMLAALLEISGARVTTATSAPAALQAFADFPPDVLLSDIGMPGEDGYSLARKVRAFEAEQGRPPVPAIALTGFAEYADRTRALEAGFQAHLTKPVKPVELVATIVMLVRP